MPQRHPERGVEGDAPTHPEGRKSSLSLSAGKIKTRAKLELVPWSVFQKMLRTWLKMNNSQGEWGGKSKEPGFLRSHSLPPHSHSPEKIEVRQEEELVTMAETGLHSLSCPYNAENPQMAPSSAPLPLATMSDFTSR